MSKLLTKKQKQALVQKTLDNAAELLKTQGRCLMVRPMGFGKTFIMVNIAGTYDDVLYVVPRRIISQETIKKYQNKKNLDNITFVTYQQVRSWGKNYPCFKSIPELDKLFASRNPLIILDEVHVTGAPEWNKSLRNLIQELPNVHVIGGTATPVRMDNRDFRWSIFNGHEIDPYYVDQGVDDGFYPEPHYVFGVNEVSSKFNQIVQDIKNTDAITPHMKTVILKELSRTIVDTSHILNVPDILKKHIGLVFGDPDYLCCMVFFSSTISIAKGVDDLVSDFATAFPHMNINPIVIHSKVANADKIKSDILNLPKTPNQIDLIVSIDMLSYGIHLKHTHCTLMYRSTYSDVVYPQQFGRGLSMDSSSPYIIFDFIGNIYRNGRLINSREAMACNHRNTNDLSWQIKDKNIVTTDYVATVTDIQRLYSIDRLATEQFWATAYHEHGAPLQVVAQKLNITSNDDVLALLKKYEPPNVAA